MQFLVVAVDDQILYRKSTVPVFTWNWVTVSKLEKIIAFTIGIFNTVCAVFHLFTIHRYNREGYD